MPSIAAAEVKPVSGHKPIRREIELDFIRGLAILLVIDFHAPTTVLLRPFLWLGWRHFGWIGVDIFFVLSGFLVGGLLIKEWKVRGRVDSKRFLIRRGFKIWPQYYIFLFALVLSGHRGFRSLWGNFLNIQNYVGGVAHTWTLAVEEHAYLILVGFLALAAYLKMRVRTLFVTVAILCVAVVAWQFFLASRGVDTYARTDTRVEGIFYGFLLAILYHAAPAHFRRLQSLIWLWLAILASGLLWLRFSPPTWWALSLTYVAADWIGISVLLLLYKHREGRQRPALYRFVAWIGLYSYGIYLWHVSIIASLVSVAGRLPHPLAVVWTACTPAVVGVSVGIVTTKLIEFPALILRDRLFPRKVDSAVGLPADVEQKTGVEMAPESISVG